MTPADQRERQLLAAILRGMAWAAALVLVGVGWLVVRGPDETQALPSLRVSDLPPGSFKWSDAPVPPPGVGSEQAARLKLLVLRDASGRVHAFYLPATDGKASVPTGGDALLPGIPCEDFAPDFRTQDIACRQAATGFDFALHHRWSLTGDNLTGGAPNLRRADGRETAGDWVWPDPALVRAAPVPPR